MLHRPESIGAAAGNRQIDAFMQTRIAGAPTRAKTDSDADRNKIHLVFMRLGKSRHMRSGFE